MAGQKMLKFVTVGKEMPTKRDAELRSHDFDEIYRQYAVDKARKVKKDLKLMLFNQSILLN